MRILVSYRAIDGIAGGVERMSIALMNHWVGEAQGHEVQFLTLDPKNASAFYPMDGRIIWHRLGIGDARRKAGWKTRLHRAWAARKIIRRFSPHLILAFQDGAFFAMKAYSLGLGVPIILAERIAPGHFDHIRAGRYRALFFRLYALADKILVQCPSYKNEYPAFLRPKIEIIPNFIAPSDRRARPDAVGVAEKILLCVGRIGYQKNQDLLVAAFEALSVRHPDWTLILAGGGALQSPCAHPRIKLLGPVRNVSDLYASAHLFCLPSRWEGFPNALAEAMAHGLPSVGFSGCGGVRDLIAHGETGLLAAGNGHLENLKAALDRLMGDPVLRETMGAQALEKIGAYRPEAILPLWDKVFQDVARAA